ncbi:MAG: hydrogenase expression/formation protein HypE [Pirellulaceae bacterium]|nr:hydrogenase expression/formation protein HypE [Pirellulaceae bacterium]
MKKLIEEIFLPAFRERESRPGCNPANNAPGHDPAYAAEAASPESRVPIPESPSPGPQPPVPHDAAVLPIPDGTGTLCTQRLPGHDPAYKPRLAFTTDSFVVNPLFFPGGDIGELAVDGTVNDLAMAGAVPEWLSAGFIIEEGFPLESLRRIVESMAAAARTAGVRIVTGDTKVVDRGKADGVFINTAGIGWVPDGVDVSPERVIPGDVILLSGDIGRHGMAIMSVREGLRFETTLESDCAPLGGLVEAMLAAGGSGIHCLRDLTRGGLAATLNEIAQDVRVGVEIDEAAVPVIEPVASACELLGLDPFYVANEGRLAAFVSAEAAERVLAAMQAHLEVKGDSPIFADEKIGTVPAAAVGPARIGTVTATHPGTVELLGAFGPGRILDLLSGEQMPRIC